MRIYTRGGDKGRTSLFTGDRVAKDDARIEALGTIDELVAALGIAKSAAHPWTRITAELERAQSRLYLAMADIAGSGTAGEDADEAARAAVAALEAEIDALDAELPPLADFVIPGTSPASAALHLARTVCRRAERRVLAASREHALPQAVGAWLNRLSDLLFVMARWVDREGPAPTFKDAL